MEEYIFSSLSLQYFGLDDQKYFFKNVYTCRFLKYAMTELVVFFA